VFVAAPDIIPPRMTIDSDRGDKHCNETQSVVRDIVRGSDLET